MRSLVIACGSGAVAPHAPALVVNGAPIDPNASGVLVVGGGSSGWPAALDTGLLYRFDASSTATLTLSGSDVTAWADLGPSGFNVAHSETGWPNPTYGATSLGGGPAVVFAQPGSDPLVRASVAANYSGNCTVAVVYEPHATATIFSTVFGHVSAGSAGLVMREDNIDSFVCSSAFYGDPRVKAAVSKTPQVVIAAVGPSVATYERNGVDVKVSGSMLAGSSITGTLTIGALSDVGVRACKSIGLLAVWNRTLSASEKTSLLAYCATKWTT